MKKYLFFVLLLAVVFSAVLVSCGDDDKKEDEVTPTPTTVTDKDGNTYKTVKIGTQNWMAENLRATATVGNTYCYGNKADSCVLAGRLYDTTAMASNPCPNGWHVPTDEEWMTLEKFIGMSDADLVKTNLRGNQDKQLLKGTSDNVGFNAIYSGYYSTDDGFESSGLSTGFWTSTRYNDGSGTKYWRRALLKEYDGIARTALPLPSTPGISYCIRCIQNQ